MAADVNGSTGRRPVVGVTCDWIEIAGHACHVVPDAYLSVLTSVAGVRPVPVPAIGSLAIEDHEIEDLDGLVFTGSPSHIEPYRYGGPPSPEGTHHDARRDDTTLPLICAALKGGVPILAVCRGFQELNVALGGTLHQNVHELQGYFDHRERRDVSVEEQFQPAHLVELATDGVLANLANSTSVWVNSLHWQGIAKLASPLLVEARSMDGLVEAARLPSASTLVLGVQWHPEWLWRSDALSRSIFLHFARAVRQRSLRRRRPIEM